MQHILPNAAALNAVLDTDVKKRQKIYEINLHNTGSAIC